MLQFFCLEVFSCLLRVSDLLCLLRTRLRVFLFKCVCVIVLVQSHMLATNALRNLNHCACHFTNSPRLSSNNMYHGFLDLFLDIAKPQPNNCFKFCKSGHRSWYWFWTYLKFWIWFQTRLQYIFKPKTVWICGYIFMFTIRHTVDPALNNTDHHAAPNGSSMKCRSHNFKSTATAGAFCCFHSVPGWVSFWSHIGSAGASGTFGEGQFNVRFQRSSHFFKTPLHQSSGVGNSETCKTSSWLSCIQELGKYLFTCRALWHLFETKGIISERQQSPWIFASRALSRRMTSNHCAFSTFSRSWLALVNEYADSVFSSIFQAIGDRHGVAACKGKRQSALKIDGLKTCSQCKLLCFGNTLQYLCCAMLQIGLG